MFITQSFNTKNVSQACVSDSLYIKDGFDAFCLHKTFGGTSYLEVFLKFITVSNKYQSHFVNYDRLNVLLPSLNAYMLL